MTNQGANDATNSNADSEAPRKRKVTLRVRYVGKVEPSPVDLDDCLIYLDDMCDESQTPPPETK